MDRGEVIGTLSIELKGSHADEVRSRLAAIVESSDDAIISKSLGGIIMSFFTCSGSKYRPKMTLARRLILPDLSVVS
jgi:hypothetical protein